MLRTRILPTLLAVAIATGVAGDAQLVPQGGAPGPVAQAPSPAAKPWQKPLLYVEWGFTNGTFTPTTLALEAASAGVGGLVVQITPENLPWMAPAKEAAHAAGLDFDVWERADETSFDQTRAELEQIQPDAYFADVEGPMADQTWTARFDQTFPQTALEHALIATGGLDESYPGGAVAAAARWREWPLTMEDYIGRPYTHPGNAEVWAYWRGWAATADGYGHRHIPCLEVNTEGAPSLRAQLDLVAPWHRAFGVYPSEEMTPDDWQALHDYLAATPA